MPKSRNRVLAALAMNGDGIGVIESIHHVAAKFTSPQSKLTLLTSKALPGADSTSNMSDTSPACSPIDNSSMDSLSSVAEQAIVRSGRSDDRDKDGPRTRSSSRRRSLESKKRASQKKNKRRREREAAAKRKLLGIAMSDTSPSDVSDHSTSASTAELDMEHDKEDAGGVGEQEQKQEQLQEKTLHYDKEEHQPITIALEPLPSQDETHPPLEADNVDTAIVDLKTVQEERQEPDETTDETRTEATEKQITVEEIKANSTEVDQDVGMALSMVEAGTEEQEPRLETPSQDAVSNSDNYIKNQNVIPNESVSNLPSWDAANETVATVAIQCLTRDQDMELSYVAILSAVTVLQGDKSTSEPPPVEAKEKVAGMYDHLLSVMCGVSESLDQEIARQGAMAPDALYTLLYNAVLQAGYQLKLETHLLIAKYLIRHKKTEEARECITHIDDKQWTGPVYRAAIVCFLFSKPRQLREAESVLESYIDYQERSTTNQGNVDQAARNWFKLQLDASKWEDIKIQYERRRARLVDAPGIIDQFAQIEENMTKSSQEQQQSLQRQFQHGRSASAAPPISSPVSGHHRSTSAQLSSSSGHERILTGHQRTPSGPMPSWPSGASATLNTSPIPAPVAKGPFSFLSSLKFTAKADSNNTKSSDTSLPSRINANRHLTVLDNGMLEDCIRHKEFEYGWKNIYERMGPSLEDSETSRIVMRMCKQAFVGNRGAQPDAPNMTERDIVFEDEVETKNDHGEEEKPVRRRDPEIWEARAWAVYNKAMINPHTFTANIQSTSTANATSSTAMFFYDILTVAICSPETSSRFLKAFKVYSTLRSDPQNQQLLRDPFVMSCMIKAIYDAVLVVVNNPEQRTMPVSSTKRHHRRSSSLSLNRSQPMTLGPLMDIAFEIYADMRNVGSIRHLPSLINLAPTSPTGRSRRNSALFGSPVPAVQPTPIVTSVSTEGSEDMAPTTLDSPRPSFTALTVPDFHDLNPTLKPNPHAKRLSTEIYLALLHLCIQLPVFRISSQVVKTILDDMKSSSGRQSSINLDRHLGAALQQYHDTWICTEAENKNSCVYQQWMYKPEAYIQEHCKVNDGEVQGAKFEPLEGLEEIGCNEQFYWDMWSAEDAQLREMIFTQQRADMLVTHITALL